MLLQAIEVLQLNLTEMLCSIFIAFIDNAVNWVAGVSFCKYQKTICKPDPNFSSRVLMLPSLKPVLRTPVLLSRSIRETLIAFVSAVSMQDLRQHSAHSHCRLPTLCLR
jgi:hypothetical protein